jgi:hypothetical protein
MESTRLLEYKWIFEPINVIFMKKLLLSTLLSLSVGSLFAQVTSLHENFDVKCVLSTNFPSDWLRYNPIAATVPQGQWTCTATSGRPTTGGGLTPGVMCTGTYGAAYHLDTSFLITPQLKLNSYPDHVYFRYDTKATNIHIGGKVVLYAVLDSGAYTPGSPKAKIDSVMAPVISVGDSTDWVTHEIDITPYKYSPIYIAFRYTSGNSDGVNWYIDNVNTSDAHLGITETAANEMSVKVLGNGTGSDVNLMVSTYEQGMHRMVITDVVGRVVYDENKELTLGSQQVSLRGLDLKAGMYFVKLTNGNSAATAKVVVSQ